MITPEQALNTIPQGLRNPLISEYNSIVQNYSFRKWTSSELSGGKFCEIVFTILKGYSSGKYVDKPEKPKDMIKACRELEMSATNPRSFQILIPRILPALYEIRNNRGVGHAGGDVDPNHIDANIVLAMTSWIMAELIRVFHNLSIQDSQKLADSIVERKIPLVWQSGEIKRVLDDTMGQKDKTLVLLTSSSGKASTQELILWIEPKNRSYYVREILNKLHKQRFIELTENGNSVELLPPGLEIAEKIISNKM